VIEVDNSILAAVATCDTKAVLRYVLGYTSVEEDAKLKAGEAGHHALAVYFQGATARESLAVFRAQYQAWADANVEPNDRLSHANCAAILQYWFDTRAKTLPFNPIPELVEIGFSVPLDDDGEFEFIGRIDNIAESKDGSGLYIVDHKFTGNISAVWNKQFQTASQITGYIWAADKHVKKLDMHRGPVVGAFINAVEFGRTPSSDRKCKEHGVLYSECGIHHTKFDIPITIRGKAQTEQWRETAINLALRYKALKENYPGVEHAHLPQMQGLFNRSCTWCEFNSFCGGGRQPNGLKAGYVYDPWHPFKKGNK